MIRMKVFLDVKLFVENTKEKTEQIEKYDSLWTSKKTIAHNQTDRTIVQMYIILSVRDCKLGNLEIRYQR